MPRRKTSAATATETIVSPPDALEPPYEGEREALADALDLLDPPPPSEPEELAPAVVTAPEPGHDWSRTPEPAPEPTKPRPSPRKVSAEVVKAETKLINLERAAQASLVACEQRWADKRRELIRSLPHDVQGMLLAGGVIDDDDCEGAARGV